MTLNGHWNDHQSRMVFLSLASLKSTGGQLSSMSLFKQKSDGSSHSTHETKVKSRNIMAIVLFLGIKCMCNPFQTLEKASSKPTPFRQGTFALFIEHFTASRYGHTYSRT